jgi:hypothetical protein
MAHFKRKKSRSSPSGNYSRMGLRNRLGDRYDDRSWLQNWPRHWDKVYHTRPCRAKNRRLEREIMNGTDPDNMVWPDGRKPHIYYW